MTVKTAAAVNTAGSASDKMERQDALPYCGAEEASVAILFP